MESKEKTEKSKPEKQEEQQQGQSSRVNEEDKELYPTQSSGQQLKADMVRQLSFMKQKAGKQMNKLQSKVPSLIPGKVRNDEVIDKESRQNYCLYDENDSLQPEEFSNNPKSTARPISPVISASVPPLSPRLHRELDLSPRPMAPPLSPYLLNEAENSPRLMFRRDIELPRMSYRTPPGLRTIPVTTRSFPTSPPNEADTSFGEMAEVAFFSRSESLSVSDPENSTSDSTKHDIIPKPVPYSDLTQNIHPKNIYFYRSVPAEMVRKTAGSPEWTSTSLFKMKRPDISSEQHDCQGSAVMSRSQPETTSTIRPSSPGRGIYDSSSPSCVMKYWKREDQTKDITKGNSEFNGGAYTTWTPPGCGVGRASHGVDANTTYNVASPPILTVPADVATDRSGYKPQGRPGIHRPPPAAPPVLHSTISQSPGPLRGYSPSNVSPYGYSLPPPLPLPPTSLLQGYGSMDRHSDQQLYYGQPSVYLEVPATPTDQESDPSTPHPYRDISNASKAAGSKILKGWSNVTSYIRRKSGQFIDDATTNLSSPTTQPQRSTLSDSYVDEEPRHPPGRSNVESRSGSGYPGRYPYYDSYDALLHDLACCCCWPLGLAARLITKMVGSLFSVEGTEYPFYTTQRATLAALLVTKINPEGESLADSCVRSMANQLSTCALLVGIAFYMVLCVMWLSLIFVAASKS